MAVVREYMNGNCRITVHDDSYINKSPEEVQAVIDRVSKLVIDEDFRRYAAALNEGKGTKGTA